MVLRAPYAKSGTELAYAGPASLGQVCFAGGCMGALQSRYRRCKEVSCAANVLLRAPHMLL
eukprot:2277354-Rhodomonas_salina.2